MSKENPIGLSELIEQVKSELLSTPPSAPGVAPLFSIDAVELEIQVTVSKEGKGGVNFHVVELGGNIRREDVQKVKVSLTPIVDKAQRLEAYKKLYPHLASQIERMSAEGTFKGATDQCDDKYE